ncbi:MAG: MFS transporter [Planctomycetota bacterium]|nr:MAG: MFS transporter [Planctomycetota bacterium]
MSDARPAKTPMNTVAWLICIIASIGFAFDIYELLMLPLIVEPALLELGGVVKGPGSDYGMWVGRLFYIPAIVGGVFGLFGGYLTDILGRRRVLTWSILLYAFSAFAAGFSTNIWMLLFFRCTTFIGVCVEFVAAVAWLAELFPEREQRERVLGYTQAFSSIGGLLVAIAYGLAVGWAKGEPAVLFFGISLPALQLPAIPLPEWLTAFGEAGREFNHYAPWRYTLMSGLIPAIPLIFIRPFLPESPAWKRKKDAGTLHRPSIRELFAPQYRRTSIITMLMFACSYGAAFGALQQTRHMLSGLPEVKQKAIAEVEGELEGKSEEERAKIIGGATRRAAEEELHLVTKTQEIGGLFGRFLLALLVVRILSQRKLIRIFQIPGLIVIPFTFAVAAIHNLDWLYIGIFFAGLFTVGQFSFWGNYLPRVYPLHLRGTGESFAANIGGRLIGTSMAWVTSNLASKPFMPGETGTEQWAYTAAIIGTAVYLAGFILSFFLPEPGEDLMDESD